MFAHKSLRAFQVWVNVDLAMNKAQPEDGSNQYDGEGLIFMPSLHRFGFRVENFDEEAVPLMETLKAVLFRTRVVLLAETSATS